METTISLNSSDPKIKEKICKIINNKIDENKWNQTLAAQKLEID